VVMVMILAEMGMVFWKAVKQQRVALACAVTVAVVLVGVFKAPILPVIGGCVGAWVVMLARAHRKPGNAPPVFF
jgi:hypothetical protein